MYKTVTELTDDQLLELKQSYLTQYLIEAGEDPSLEELSNADELVADTTIFELYSATHFTDDDFFCTSEGDD